MLLNLSSRKKEMLLTVTSNLLLQIVTAGCGFILPPLIISTFGSSVNGMVASISQFIAYLNIVEAGVGGAAIAALYKPLALGDTKDRNAILSATTRFYNRSGVLFTVLIFVLAFVYPFIVGNEVDRLQSALMVLVLGITGVSDFFLIGKYRVLLTADKKVYVISLAQIGALIFSTIFSVFLIKKGFSIVFVKLVSSLIFITRYLFLSLYIRLHYLKICFQDEPNKEAICQSKNVLIHQMCSLIVFNSPVIIITFLCSLSEISVYTVYALVFTAVNQLLGSFSNGMQSFFGESLFTDSIEQTRSLFSRYEIIFFAIEGWFYAMAYLLIIPFMNIYTKNMTDALYIQPALALLFVLVGVLNNLRIPSSQLIIAAGHFRKTQWRSILEACINVVFGVVCTFIFGMKGVLLGTVCSGLYRGIDIIIYSNLHILRSRKFIFKSFLRVIAFFLFFYLAVIACRLIHISINNYFSWFVYAVITGLLLAFPLGCFFLISRTKFFNIGI